MQSTVSCSVDGCSARVRSLGLCESHYKKSRYKPASHAMVCQMCGLDYISGNLRRVICYEVKCSRELTNAKAREQGWSRKHRSRHGRPASTVAADRRRDAALRGATVGKRFTNSEVFERDGWVCGICSDKVDQALTYPDPMSVSLDHVIPVSKGGKHSLSNVRCSHLACNVRRGADV